MEIKITKKQGQFVTATADEVLFGGAAGGGKSYAQIIDALIFAVKYGGSRQLILRRTFPELRRSLILTALSLYPKSICKYHETNHRWTFLNGSIIEFGFCDSESDVTKYQSAEYDVIRFDELTHFTEFQFVYLLSRVRGANDFPKQIKSSTNPGGVGHSWVKKRYIDVAPPNKVYTDELKRTRVFIPALVEDNKFLMERDKGYVRRLKSLDESSKKALLYGEWDLFEGQYFSEFRVGVHTIPPFKIPKHYKRYFSVDYGLDMLAGLWIALDDRGCAFVYREVYEPNLIITQAAKRIIELEDGEEIYARFAPPDLFNRRQESGRSVIDIFADRGLYFEKSSNDRVAGWYAVKEFLKEGKNEFGEGTAKLKIFDNCINLIRTLPALCFDGRNKNDVSNTPHELTHAPDALRGFCVMNVEECGEKSVQNNRSEISHFLNFGV